MTDFSNLVPHIEDLLRAYHGIISSQVKAEIWEEICAKALDRSGFGTDWKPDFNHGIGTDQTTDSKDQISNKAGQLSDDELELTISGSRLTRFATLDEKVSHIHNKNEDYILCLASKKNFGGEYHFIVIDADDLDYGDVEWNQKIGQRGAKKGHVVGWEAHGDGYYATITISMSDQLWTTIDSGLFLSHNVITL